MCGNGVAKESRTTVATVSDGTGGTYVRHKGTDYKTLKVVDYPRLKTKAMINQKGIVPPGSKAIVVLLHGTGAGHSHMGAMTEPARVFTAAADENGMPGKILRAVGAWGENHLALGGIAFDLPGHGFNEADHLLELDGPAALEGSVEWLAGELELLKKEHGLPVVVFARSGSPGIVLELNGRRPGLVDAMILMSPSHSRPDLDQMSVQACLHLAATDSSFTLNPEGFDWINLLYRNMTWHTWPKPAGDTPTLVLMGREDPETPEEAREAFRQMARDNPNVQYAEFERGRHDLLNTHDWNRATLMEAWAVIYRFLRGALG